MFQHTLIKLNTTVCIYVLIAKSDMIHQILLIIEIDDNNSL